MKKLSKLFCITALAAVTGFALIVGLIACKDAEFDYDREHPVPKELWGTWDDSNDGQNGNLYITTLKISEHHIESDGNGTNVKNGARSAGGKKIEIYELVTWATFCNSYDIQNDKVTFTNFYGMGGNNKFTKK